MEQFKGLIRKFPQVFYLPSGPISSIKGFQHNIETGNHAPVYRLPYHKSPSEMAVIKQELELVAPVTDSNDLHVPEDALIQPDTSSLADAVPSQNSPLAQVALEFALYLQRQLSKSAISSKACKFLYEKFPLAR